MDRMPIVRIDPNEMDRGDLIEPVCEEFARKTGMSITVSNPLGRVKSPYFDNDFDLCIYFWCVPERAEPAAVEIAYGYATNRGQEDGYVLPGDRNETNGIRIVDPDGVDVALIVGKTLYVLFDLPHSSRGERNYADKILQRIFDDYGLFLVDRRAFDLEMRKRLGGACENRFARAYIDALGISVSSDPEETERELQRNKKKFLTVLRKRSVFLRDGTVGEVTKFAEENIPELYRRLCKLSATGSIRMNYQSVCVPMGQIDIEDRGTVYDIGYLELWIDLIGDRLRVRCINATRVVSGCFHPHVSDDGSPCLGSIRDGVKALLKARELELLILVMGDYLRSYNDNSPYSRIDEWPVRRVLKPPSEEEWR